MSATWGMIDLPGPAPTPDSTLNRLADEVQSVCQQPIDVLQVAALLETAGITDNSAMLRYGYVSVFDLAESVTRRIAPLTAAPSASAPTLAPPEVRWQAAMDYLRGPLTLLPMVLLSAVIMIYQSYGEWSSAQVLAFSLSVVTSLLVTSGFVQAASRKGSSYLSQGYIVAARRIVSIIMGAGLVAVCAVGGMLMAVVLRYLAPPTDVMVTMGVSFLVLSCLWLAAGALFLLGQVIWFGLGLAVGISLIAAVLHGLSLWVGERSWAMLAATFVGFCGALLVMSLAARRTLAHRAAASPVSSQAVLLPATPHLLVNLAPYFAYGVLYVVLVLSGHVSGWLSATPAGADRMMVVTATEVGLTIALGGVILAGGVAERTVARFWRLIKTYQLKTSPAQPAEFSRLLQTFFRREYLRYGVVLALCSVLVAVLLLIFQAATFGRGAAILPWTAETQLIMALGLVGYGIMALGVFQCMFLITLSRPGMATEAVVIGIACTLIVGALAGRLTYYPYSALGVICGSLAFTLAARRHLQQVLRQADYYYYASF